MEQRRRYLLLGCALTVVVTACRGVQADRPTPSAPNGSYDPVTMDPPARAFSRTHALEDVHAALRWARSGSTAARFRADTARVVLVGHSMGGWLGLMTAAADPRVKCVAGLDSRNTGAYARMLNGNHSADSAVLVATDSLTAPGAPYRTEGGGAALVSEMKANADRWDLTAHASALADRPVLLVSSVFRADHEGLVSALNRAGARRVTALTWDTDHSFSDRRIALARTVIDWLRSSCA